MKKNKNGLKLQLDRETVLLLEQDLSKVAGGTSYNCTYGTCDLGICLNEPLTARCV